MSSSTDLAKPATSGVEPANAIVAGRNFVARYRNVIVPIVALVGLVAYFGIKNHSFISTSSFDNILRQMSFLTVLALAGTFVILIGGIDLSVAANATLAGILIAKWIDTFGGPLAIVLVLLVGAAVGLVNGIVTTVLKVPSFLVTLGMMSVLDGISNTISDGGPVSYQSGLLSQLVNQKAIPGLPNGALIALALIAGFTVVVFATTFGRHLYAVGGNERAARLSGVRVKSVKLVVFALAGMVAAVAGIILTGQASTGVPLGADRTPHEVGDEVGHPHAGGPFTHPAEHVGVGGAVGERSPVVALAPQGREVGVGPDGVARCERSRRS